MVLGGRNNTEHQFIDFVDSIRFVEVYRVKERLVGEVVAAVEIIFSVTAIGLRIG